MYLASSVIGAIDQNKSTTEIVATTVPAVKETTRYYYYACIFDTCSEPVTIQVQPTVQEPEQEPVVSEDITVTDITATPTNPESGTPITIQVTVRNNGATTLDSKTVRVYQHRSTTNNPTVRGRIPQTATTGTLDQNESTTEIITTIAPTVTEVTRYYYYACIDTICSESATIQVQPTVQEPEQEPEIVAFPEPPYNCWEDPARNVLAGGDYAFFQPAVVVGTTAAGCISITLGGLETADGTKGFVMSAHAVGFNFSEQGTPYSDIYFANRWDEENFQIKGVFGKLLNKVPRTRTEGTKEIVIADAAFVSYSRANTSGCSVTWQYNDKVFCFDIGQGEYTEEISPLTIRGRGNNVYKVVGSRQPVKGLEVNLSGSVSGVHEGLHVTNTAFLIKDYLGYAYVGTASRTRSGLPIAGDSGSPIYTVPDKNGNVRIVGILVGIIPFVGGTELMFSSWDDVTDSLGLKPVSP